MTFGDLASVVGSALAGGGIWRFASKWVDARREKARASAEVAVRALELVEAEREDTQQHVTGRMDCERRCGSLERKNERLRRRVDALERDKAELLDRVASLEKQVDAMRRALEALAPRVSAVSRSANGRKDE